MTDATNPPGPYTNAPLPTGPVGGTPLEPVDFGTRPLPVPDAHPAPTPDGASSGSGSDASAKDKAADAAQAGKQAAADTAQAGKQAAADVANTATDAAKDVARQTSEQAKDLLGKTRTQLNEQAATQQHSLVETLRDLADQLAGMADTDQDGTAVELVTQARDHARHAADWLDQRDPGDVVNELRELGRRRPGAFLLGSAAAGVLAGRLTRGVAAAHSDAASGSAGTGAGSHREAGS
jgi:hypothetical protein